MSAVEEEIVADDPNQPEPTLREQLESARDEVVARQESEHVSGEQAGSDSVRTSTDRGDGRTARGQFASRQSADSADQTTPDQASRSANAGGATGAQAIPAGSEQPTGPVALPAPGTWKPEEKALWAKVPPEVQHIIDRRERDVARAISAQDEVRLIGNNFMQVSNQHAPLIQARGLSPVDLWRESLGIISQLSSPDMNVRANIVRQIAHANGVDLRSLIGQQPGAPGQPQQPNLPIDQLVARQVNEAFQAEHKRQAQERERAEMQAVNSEIETFRSKVDAQGQLAYPYFDHVNSLMAALLGAGNASTLEEAYQLAVRAHPETSQLIEQAQTAARKAEEEKRQRAQAARRKSGSLRTGPGNAPGLNGKDLTLRDEIRAAMAEASGRV